jgi:hypothetical protein
MVGVLVLERGSLKLFAYQGEACIQAHKARTQLAISEQLPSIDTHLTLECEAGSSSCNTEHAFPFNSKLNNQQDCYNNLHHQSNSKQGN